ncbi:sulfite exporter TauE/SafE family protein [Micrococcales bacterium 31B]|nr:sulfite exporter TauE/SafE family protein [Micrococcales bacterium 31B]
MAGAYLGGRPRDESAAPARPFTFIAVGVGVGILTGLLGVGGGFLLVPVLTLLGGLRLNVAIGTSLVIIAFNSVSGLLSHLGHLDLPWVLVAGATVSALLGTLVGMRISARVPLPVLRRGFGVSVLVVGGAVLAVESRQWV